MDMLDLTDNTEELYAKYLFLNKRQIELRLYPLIRQRWNARNRTGSLLIDGSSKLNTFAVKTMFLCNSNMNNTFAYEFLKIYYKHLDELRQKQPFANNFYDNEIASSRLCIDNRVLLVHEGARDFYKRVGFYSNNPDYNCKFMMRECTDEQIAKYGDYLKYYNSLTY